MKTNNFLLNFVFLLIVNGEYCCEIVAMDSVETSIEQFFTKIWTNSPNPNSEVGNSFLYLEKYANEPKNSFKIAKHLIGRGHVLDISEVEVNKKGIPTRFLFVLINDKDVNLFKFFRELYGLSNDGGNGHPQGALSILKSDKSLQDKQKAVASLVVTFGYAQQSKTFEVKKIQDKILDLQKDIEKNAEIEEVKNRINTFNKKLNADTVHEKFIENLLEKFSEKSYNIYNGELVKNLKEAIEFLKKEQSEGKKILNLYSLKAVISNMKNAEESIVSVDISNQINDIATLITNTYFNGEGKTKIDQLIVDKFCDPVQRYLQNFLKLENLTIEKDKTIKRDEKEKKDTIGISLTKKFLLEANSKKNEKFKAFICESTKQNEAENETIKSLSPPTKDIKVTLSLRSELRQPPEEGDEKIIVEDGENKNEYGISSAYLATFFPSAH